MITGFINFDQSQELNNYSYSFAGFYQTIESYGLLRVCQTVPRLNVFCEMIAAATDSWAWSRLCQVSLRVCGKLI